MDSSDQYYYYQHSWKVKLRQLGRQVRKLLASGWMSSILPHRRRAGYIRIQSEEEQQFSNNTTFPPGLLSLMRLDQLYFVEKFDALEESSYWGSEKSYRIVDLQGRNVYDATERSNSLARSLLGKYRCWEYFLFDANRREVMRVSRGFACGGCCMPWCLQSARVYVGRELLGSIRQIWSPWRPTFTINDADGLPVLLMKGPLYIACANLDEFDFLIKSIDRRHRVGVLTRKCEVAPRSVPQDDVSFVLGFPGDLDAKIKAVLIGACFLMDSMYYEGQLIDAI